MTDDEAEFIASRPIDPAKVGAAHRPRFVPAATDPETAASPLTQLIERFESDRGNSAVEEALHRRLNLAGGAVEHAGKVYFRYSSDMYGDQCVEVFTLPLPSASAADAISDTGKSTGRIPRNS